MIICTIASPEKAGYRKTCHPPQKWNYVETLYIIAKKQVNVLTINLSPHLKIITALTKLSDVFVNPKKSRDMEVHINRYPDLHYIHAKTRAGSVRSNTASKL